MSERQLSAVSRRTELQSTPPGALGMPDAPSVIVGCFLRSREIPRRRQGSSAWIDRSEVLPLHLTQKLPAELVGAEDMPWNHIKGSVVLPLRLVCCE